MPIRFSKQFGLMAALAISLTLATAAPAKAGLVLTLLDVSTATTITITDNGVGDTDLALKTISYSNVAFGNFDVDITIKTNSPGAFVVGSGVAGRVQDITITTSNLAVATDTLKVTVSSDGFTDPVDPVIRLDNTLAASAIDPGGSGTFVSALNGTPTPTVSLTAPGSVTSTVFIGGPSYPYTLTNEMNITLTGLGSAQLTGTTLASAPEPATLAMAFTGLPILGLGLWLRRRGK